MRLWIASALLVVSTSTTAWGAGALAVGDGHYGYARNMDSRSEAEQRALRECGHRGCRVVMTFHNTCAAYASARNGAGGWAWNDDIDEAGSSALGECRAHGGRGCEINMAKCDGD